MHPTNTTEQFNNPHIIGSALKNIYTTHMTIDKLK